MPENDPAQRYRDWLMACGMVRHINEAAASYAKDRGLPAPPVRELPPPPKGSLDDIELRQAQRKQRAQEKRDAKKAARA